MIDDEVISPAFYPGHVAHRQDFGLHFFFHVRPTIVIRSLHRLGYSDTVMKNF